MLIDYHAMIVENRKHLLTQSLHASEESNKKISIDLKKLENRANWVDDKKIKIDPEIAKKEGLEMIRNLFGAMG